MITAGIPFEHSSGFAWQNYKDEVAQLIAAKASPDIIEIGAGRSPLFSQLDLPANVHSYTISDISRRELELAPGPWNRACFDVCGDVRCHHGKFDVAFTRMLAEHVTDGYRFHANVFSLLKSGGVAFHFLPTLYSPPFVINKLLPEALSGWLLRALFAERNDDAIPKFPARYSMCRGKSSRQMRRLRSIGYANVDVKTFYGHDYFSKIPLIRELDRGLTRLAYTKGLAQLGAYAYLTLAKPQ